MDNLKFFYLVKEVQQLTFDGLSRAVSVPHGDLHFISPESPDTTLCGEYKEILKTKGGTRKFRQVSTRPEGVRTCELCEKACKNMKNSAWKRWEINVQRRDSS